MTDLNFTAYDIALVPAIVGLVSLIRTFGVPPRWLPLIAMALGQIVAFVYVEPDDPKEAVLAGIVMGLAAIGMWSGVKNTVFPGGNTGGSVDSAVPANPSAPAGSSGESDTPGVGR